MMYGCCWEKTDVDYLWDKGQSSHHFTALCLVQYLGACFSKVPIINGSVKLLLFTCKIEVSIVLHLTRKNYQLLKQNGVGF